MNKITVKLEDNNIIDENSLYNIENRLNSILKHLRHDKEIRFYFDLKNSESTGVKFIIDEEDSGFYSIDILLGEDNLLLYGNNKEKFIDELILEVFNFMGTTLEERNLNVFKINFNQAGADVQKKLNDLENIEFSYSFFWELINSSQSNIETLSTKLKEYNSKNILYGFNQALNEVLLDYNTEFFLNLFKFSANNFSDDSFLYWRCGIVLMGEEVHKSFVKNGKLHLDSEIVMKIIDKKDELEEESLLYVSSDVFDLLGYKGKDPYLLISSLNE